MSKITLVYCFVAISIVAAIIDFILAYLIRGQRANGARYLRKTCAMAGAVVLFYSLAILSKTYTQYSVASSLYFASISYMLLNFMYFSIKFTRHRRNRKQAQFFAFITFVDIIVQIVNIFVEISVHYIPISDVVSAYKYEMHLPYIAHLCLAYLMLVIALALLIQKLYNSPEGYRMQFAIPVVGVVLVSVINAAYLFLPKSSYNLFDYSVLGYPIASYFIYWSAFKYKKERMLDHFRGVVVNNIDQGIALFDYQDRLILWNNQIVEQIPSVDFEENMAITKLKHRFVSLNNVEFENEAVSVQCGYLQSEKNGVLRCDYRPIFGKRNVLVGRLLVFTSLETEIDIITGFQNIDNFNIQLNNNPDMVKYPAVVFAFDINMLKQINTSMGTAAGDMEIKNLSTAMIEAFPNGTHFVRAREAVLGAVCSNKGEEEGLKFVRELHKYYIGRFQYGMCVADGNIVSVKDAAIQARQNMRIKKLIDETANHSSALTSLICALEETDSDTEAHVKRTARLSHMLAKEIKLSDTKKTQLSLLCLLHDIGKIGVPLDILNKPGRLSDAEWKVLQSHAEKGYQICQSTEELHCIADMVKHHHERWDGKGYPDGLAGEDIPLLSRIIAVVDAYDAMVNDRSYRKALPEWKARAEIKSNAGTQFDPYIAKRFIELLDNIDSTTEENDIREQEQSITPETESSAASKENVIANGNTHIVKYSKYILDSDNNIIEVDDKFEEITGYSEEDVKRAKLKQIDLIFDEDRVNYFGLVSKYLGKDSLAYFEHRLRRKDGKEVNVMCVGRIFYDSAEKELRSEILITDINDSQAIRKIETNAAIGEAVQKRNTQRNPKRDTLTGLYREKAFMSEIELKLISSKRYLLLAIVRLDDFMKFKDSNGIFDAEVVLKSVAKIINDSLRAGDVACKMEEGKFAFLIEFDPSIDEPRMRQRLARIFDPIEEIVKGTDSSLGVSIGVAVATDNSMRSAEFIELAESHIH